MSENEELDFSWLETQCTPIFRPGARFCGYLAKGLADSKAGSLRMQFLCPLPLCKKVSHLAIHIVGRTTFIVSAEEFYDMDAPVLREGSEVIYMHGPRMLQPEEINESPHKSIKILPFKFIHQCRHCEGYLDTVVRWKEKWEGFDLLFHRCENKTLESARFDRIDLVQQWVMVGVPGLNLSTGDCDGPDYARIKTMRCTPGLSWKQWDIMDLDTAFPDMDDTVPYLDFRRAL